MATKVDAWACDFCGVLDSDESGIEDHEQDCAENPSKKGAGGDQ